MDRDVVAVIDVPEVPEPLDELADFTATAAGLFYVAEHGENPSVADFWDAYHYVATSLSVGYAQVHPVTPMGKVIGSIVQMLGPSLSSHALDPPTAREGAQEAALLGRLDAILAELRALRGVGA